MSNSNYNWLGNNIKAWTKGVEFDGCPPRRF